MSKLLNQCSLYNMNSKTVRFFKKKISYAKVLNQKSMDL